MSKDHDERVPNNLELLLAINSLKALIDAHIAEENATKPQLLELLDTFQKSKGVFWFFRAVIYIGAPIGALVYWLKDHVRI